MTETPVRQRVWEVVEAAKLRIQWSDKQITVGSKSYDITQHAWILIFPILPTGT